MRRCELTTRGLIFQASISKIEIFAQSRFHFGDSSLQVKSLALILLATRSCGFAIGERDLFLSHFPKTIKKDLENKVSLANLVNRYSSVGSLKRTT